MTALAVVIMSALFVARDALILIYISALVALGFGPVVRAVEHQQLIPVGKRLPRWLAILVVYLVDHRRAGRHRGAGGSAARRSGASALERPAVAVQSCAGLLDPVGMILKRRLTLEEAVQSVPTGESTTVAATSAVGTVATALGTVVEIGFAFITDRHPGVLPAG